MSILDGKVHPNNRESKWIRHVVKRKVKGGKKGKTRMSEKGINEKDFK